MDYFQRLAELPDSILACPSCGDRLEWRDGVLFCPRKNLPFSPMKGLPALLPHDFTFTAELLEEDRFYTEEPKVDYGPAHRLAHTRAREVVRDGCELAGLGGDAWVLSIGTGGGYEIQFVRAFTQHILAVDISPHAMAHFLEENPYAGMLATAEHLPFCDGTIDAIVMSGILHHVAGHGSMAPYLTECYRVLKPGGAIIIAEPNRLYPIGFLMSLVDPVVQRVRPGARHHVPHERPLIPGRLQRAAQTAGFKKVQLLGTTFCHNKFPYALAKFVDAHLGTLARKPVLKHFSYWIGCVGIK